MSRDSLLTHDEIRMLNETVLARDRLEEQYHDFEHQHLAASTGMWVFLATEVMFFGAVLLALALYRMRYGEAFEAASEKLDWIVGAINTLVLLASSFTIVMAVHSAQLGSDRGVAKYLAVTALLGVLFLAFKAFEYYSDYQENLIPGWRFVDAQWTELEGLRAAQVPQVELFLTFYWVLTLIHALHVTIGIAVVLVVAALAWGGHFSPYYYSPVEVTALYWHFVDIVWIFLLPLLYLQGTHSLERLGH